MIDAILKSLLSGITVIEDCGSSVGRIFAEQIASNAASIGRKTVILSMRGREEVLSELELYSFNPSIEVMEADRATAYGSLLADLVIMDSFSNMVFDYSEKDLFDLMKGLRAETRRGASFVLCVEPDVLTDRASALLRSLADSLVVVKVEFAGVRITRYLYFPKVRGRIPLTKMLKFTLDEKGVQIDTRELVG